MFKTFGIPVQIVSDRGTCFTSKSFRDFCGSRGVKHTLISSRHPQSNGAVEHVIRTLVAVLSTTMDGQREWDEILPDVERQINSAVSKHTGATPYEALMGYKITRSSML